MVDGEQYKTQWISANYAEIRKSKTIQVKTGTRSVLKRKGLFSGEKVEVEEDIMEPRVVWEGTGTYSDTRIDSVDLATRIQKACNEQWEAGYDLVQVLDTLEGRYNYAKGSLGAQVTGGWGYGYGYSLTDGVVLLFRRRTHGDLPPSALPSREA